MECECAFAWWADTSILASFYNVFIHSLVRHTCSCPRGMVVGVIIMTITARKSPVFFGRGMRVRAGMHSRRYRQLKREMQELESMLHTLDEREQYLRHGIQSQMKTTKAMLLGKAPSGEREMGANIRYSASMMIMMTMGVSSVRPICV